MCLRDRKYNRQTSPNCFCNHERLVDSYLILPEKEHIATQKTGEGTRIAENHQMSESEAELKVTQCLLYMSPKWSHFLDLESDSALCSTA